MTSRRIPLGLGLRRRLRSGVTLIHRGHLDHVCGHGLNLPRQVCDLRALLLIGRRNLQGQEMPQRVHRDRHFAAFAPFGASVAAACSALRGGLQGAAIEDDGGGFRVPIRQQPQHGPPIMRHRLLRSLP